MKNLPQRDEQGRRVVIARSIPEMEALRPHWETLGGAPESDIDFFRTILEANPETVRPHVIAVFQGEQLLSILVGRIDKGPVVFRALRSPVKIRANQMFFVYGALRGEESPEICKLLVEVVRKSLSDGEADLANFNVLPQGSELLRCARTTAGFLSRDHITMIRQHYFAQLPATAEEFQQNLSSKLRKNQRRAWKQLLDDFPNEVSVRCFKEPDEVEALASVAEGVAKSSYQRGIGVGFVDDEGTRSRLRLKAGKGWMRGYVLMVAQKPAAFWIGDIINSKSFGSDYLAFDPTYAKYAPGMSLMMRVIEGFCGGAEGISSIDFGTGYAEYKERLSTELVAEEFAYIFAPTLKGALLNCNRAVFGRAEEALRRGLTRTGLLQRVKKAWHSRAIAAATR